ncbi:MAG: hypothetical protein CM15mP128_0650 [Methanobacteriota archaeon]|nr:MAG: hypothetical protein CM15mP128_0650 [Euryarchaeota archaeon]
MGDLEGDIERCGGPPSGGSGANGSPQRFPGLMDVVRQLEEMDPEPRPALVDKPGKPTWGVFHPPGPFFPVHRRVADG